MSSVTSCVGGGVVYLLYLLACALKYCHLYYSTLDSASMLGIAQLSGAGQHRVACMCIYNRAAGQECSCLADIVAMG
jgi:hypothetical protein